MKKIGCFTRNGPDYTGIISLLSVDIPARIAPVPHKAQSSGPDYNVTKIGEGGFDADLGNAWQSYLPAQEMPFLAVILDNPALQRPMRAVMCQNSDGLWYLYWDRVTPGEIIVETLYVQEELKPQIGIMPISHVTLSMQVHYPDLTPA